MMDSKQKSPDKKAARASEGSWAARDEKSSAAFEALFDSGYSSSAALSVHSASSLFQSQSSVDFESEFDEKLSLRNSGPQADSGLCIDSGLDISSEVHISSASSLTSENLFRQSTSQFASGAAVSAFQPDEDGDTLLHLSVIKGLVDVSYAITRIAPHPDYLDISNNLFQTPLQLSVLTRQSNVARRLVIAGATVDKRDRRGNTALHLACESGDMDCAKAILNPILPGELSDSSSLCGYRTKVTNTLNPSELIDQMNYEGQTCVHLAGRSGNLRLLEYLVVECKGNVNARDGKNGRTLLHWAVASHKVGLVQFLLSACKAQVNALCYANHTPLFLAWCLYRLLPNNSKVRKLIMELTANGGEPSTAPLASDDSSSSDDDDSDEEMGCSAEL